MNSSYTTRDIDYAEVLTMLIKIHKPHKVIEFGILNGYSLQIISETIPQMASIDAYDIFEDFTGNYAQRDIINKFTGINIAYGDFYEKYAEIKDGSVDLLHIDIANNGDVYKFAIEKYISKIRNGGLIILEGGSEKRDKIDWMIKYNKPPIRPVLDEISKKYTVCTLGIIPSITLIHKNSV
jgi:predicted O-methyltransferase YrrM